MIPTIEDHIEKIVHTSGFIYNNNDSKIFYMGYKIFIRNHIDRYDSIYDWREDTNGSVTEYTMQKFIDGYNIICDSGINSMCVTDTIYNILEPLYIYRRLDVGIDWVPSIVNMHRQRYNLPTLSAPIEHIDISLYIDSNSPIAILEDKRMSINLKETQLL